MGVRSGLAQGAVVKFKVGTIFYPSLGLPVDEQVFRWYSRVSNA